MAFPFDQSYKLLSEEDAKGSITYVAGVPLSADAVVESLERELNMERLHADHLYRVHDRGKECIHHFEALAHYRAGWEEPQIDHAIYVALKYRLPVFSHLLVMHARGAPRTIPDRISRVCGGLRQTIRVNVIRLWRQPVAGVLASESVALYPWTALMDATLEQQREAARRLKASGREGFQLQMTLLGALRYGSREAFIERIGRMLLTKDILRESPMWQEIEREGKAAGEAIGEAKGLRRAVRQLLTLRFGPVPEWANQRIDAADLETLELLHKRAATSASLDEVLQ